MNHFSFLLVALFSLILPLIMAGCGGGNSSSNTDPEEEIIIDPVPPTDPASPLEPTQPSIPTDTSGYLTEVRFTLSAQACLEALSEQALSVDDSLDVFSLASEGLTCTQKNDANNLLYSISWSGNDFNHDGEKDTLTFDVRVESFIDSTFIYSEQAGQSSMTALGTSSTFSQWIDEDDQHTSVWDIDGDTEEGIGQGQSLRFSAENITLSLAQYQVAFNGFNTINVIETKSGREHTHIRGEGTGLDSGTTDGSDTFNFDPVEAFVITGSGDYYDFNIWGISDIQFSFSIDNPDVASANTTDWLAGSWGITYPVFGGERLDEEVDNNYDYRAGAQKIVDDLPAVGHIITNLSYFAHSYYFTLRQNDNIDIATEIHESLVPSLENEKIILDVLQTFKDGDKKIILYISTNYMLRASEEAQAAWLVYYTNEFGGDEYLAYEHLIQGFIERFKDYADGYWLDTTDALNDDGKLQDFISMIKKTDPTSVVTANQTKNYFTDNGVTILVDSDGLDDIDESDYKIVKHEPLNTYQDFTNGHVTPISQGAPVNSWAYEEYTLPNMINQPVVNYNGKSVLKHAWFPVRERWHVPTQPLVFGVEQAYRFVKTVIDGNASLTFATTTSDKNTTIPGYLMQDEMDIMKEINARLLMEPSPTPEVYIRPEGAALVVAETVTE